MSHTKPTPSLDANMAEKNMEADAPEAVHDEALVADAKHASDVEHSMSLLTAMKT